jgi:hypothetical protein
MLLYDGLFVGCQGGFVTNFRDPSSQFPRPQWEMATVRIPLVIPAQAGIQPQTLFPLRDLVPIPKQGRGKLKSR